MTVIRTGEFDGARSTAVFSECGRHRFLLSRRWDEQQGSILFLMLNPSTADESRNDPTIGRCHGFAIRLNNGRTGGYMVCNLFSLVTPDRRKLTTDPSRLRQPANDAHIARACQAASRVICAWGGSGSDAAVRKRAGDVVEMVTSKFGGPMECFGVNRNGAPVHPLYQPVGARLIDWKPENYFFASQEVQTR